MRMRTWKFVPMLALFLVVHEVPAATKVKVGVLVSMSSFISDLTGQGSVEAAKLAIEDFRKRHPGTTVELVSADHQNKPDVATGIVREWFDRESVDVLLDGAPSPVSLAVTDIVKDKNKVFLASSASHSDLSGKKCNPNTVQWTYTNWAFANGTGKAVVRQGGNTWFFMTADYAYGHSLEKETADTVKAAGGKVLGTVRHPVSAADLSSFLLQAQASKAKVIALANAGGDTINSIKQAAEFGVVPGKQNLAALNLYITDVHAMGLKTAQGLMFTTAFYWDLNESTRAFSKRFASRMNGKMPTQAQAGAYSSLLNYLLAVERAGSPGNGARVVAEMRNVGWFEDPLFGRTRVQENGGVQHAMYLTQVKTPSESRAPWDYYKILQKIPEELAFQPKEQTGCPLVK
ncbi:branched-chain amino acid transport system substrate-binding protein [Ottowia thiooxydans]|uniref:Branched-chain amino acid transport system substrate-binding protein n=2 Tax=Ottowia thiooxydans TaxID=219182 RepID=A0ABV2QAM8_9BURK